MNSYDYNDILTHHHPTIADSGATDTLIRLSDVNKLLQDANITHETQHSLRVSLPNRQQILSIGTGYLQLCVNMRPICAHIFRDEDLDCKRFLLA